MNNSPLISIITVCYNAAKTVENTILSVLNQTYPNIEYIIIDGGSTDGTLDIIKKYQDKITYWVSEPDKGIYDAMNKGTLKATGEWLNFMNAGDTFYDEQVLEKVFKDKDWSNTDVIYGDVDIEYPKKIKLKKPLSLKKIEQQMVFCHQGSFVKTVLQKQYLFNLTYKISADYDFFHQLYIKGKHFHYLSFVISKFLFGGLSSNAITKMLVESWHISGTEYNIFYIYTILKVKIIEKIKRLFRL